MSIKQVRSFEHAYLNVGPGVYQGMQGMQSVSL